MSNLTKLRRLMPGALLTVVCWLPLKAHACFEDAAKKHDVPVELLKAIAQVESNGDPEAVSHNKDGSENIGLMQISTLWLPSLARLGVTREKLHDACTNVRAGALILAGYMTRYGRNWLAVEAYNAGYPRKQLFYARRVQLVMPSLKFVFEE